MPKSLAQLPPESAHLVTEVRPTGRMPLRKRIVKQINGFDVNMPTRTKVTAKSITPIY